jgi:hypothetical protein
MGEQELRGLLVTFILNSIEKMKKIHKKWVCLEMRRKGTIESIFFLIFFPPPCFRVEYSYDFGYFNCFVNYIL